MPKDYYDILGVPRSATDAEIKRAFRQRARQLHPDVNTSPDATRQFQQVNEAYQVLSDPLRRSTYDRTGSASRVRVRAAPKARPAASQSASSTSRRYSSTTQAPPSWSPPGPSAAYRPEPHEPYQYSWRRQPQTPSWIPRLARLMRHFIASPFFWIFIIVQFVAILALPTGAPLLGSTGWTIVWFASFALPIAAIVIGVRKTAE